MSQKPEQTYRGRNPLKTMLKVFFIIILTIVILAVVLFFYFQRYIVYTENGIRLDLPFSIGTEDSQPAVNPEDTEEIILGNH